MSIASTRAQAIAQILWQLKKAERLASFTSIANRVGFSPGPSGKTVSTLLKTVRRDWPQLQWWRAVNDNGQVDSDQHAFLAEAGFESEPCEEGGFIITSLSERQMMWEEPSEIED